MSCSLRVSNVTKTYYGVGKVLDGLNLEASAGDAVLILGPNGSGKTTLLKIIAGIEPVDGGEAFVNGLSTKKAFARRHIGLVLDKPGLYPELTVRENLEFYSRLRGEPAPGWALELLGLTGVMERRVGELSFGWRRRADLARALIGRPALLLVDEPYTGQDQDGREAVSTIISRVAKTGCVVATSPDESTKKLYDWSRVLVLRGGRLEPV
ncbi:MAG: ABC transporter ATP-binding protein [Desulfurococcales archaeon]|nr:ABC transporter ATP-binding protein [Desulfurococcales archaeon]